MVSQRLAEHSAELYKEGHHGANVESMDHSGEHVCVIISKDGNRGALEVYRHGLSVENA